MTRSDMATLEPGRGNMAGKTLGAVWQSGRSLQHQARTTPGLLRTGPPAVPVGGAAMNSLIRAPSRLGKKSTKFDVELASVEAIHPAIEGKLVSLRWVRDGKSGGAPKNVLATPDGRAIWSAADALELCVTLYRAEGAAAFDGKDMKITVSEVVKAGSLKTLATAKIDIAQFAHLAGTSKRAKCELTLLSDDGNEGRIRFTVACSLHGKLPPRCSDQTQDVSHGTAESARPNQEIRARSDQRNADKAEELRAKAKQIAAAGQNLSSPARRHGGDGAKRVSSALDARNSPASAPASRQHTATRRKHKESHGMAAWERRALGLSSGSEDECERAGDTGEGEEEDDDEEAASLEALLDQVVDGLDAPFCDPLAGTKPADGSSADSSPSAESASVPSLDLSAVGGGGNVEKKRREKGSAETGPSTLHSGGTGSPGTGTARHSSTIASEIAPKKRAASPRPSLASVLAEGEVHRQTSSTRIGAMVAAKTRAAAAADCSDPSSGVSGSGNAGAVADSHSLLPLRPTRETQEHQGERARMHGFPDMAQHQPLSQIQRSSPVQTRSPLQRRRGASPPGDVVTHLARGGCLFGEGAQAEGPLGGGQEDQPATRKPVIRLAPASAQTGLPAAAEDRSEEMAGKAGGWIGHGARGVDSTRRRGLASRQRRMREEVAAAVGQAVIALRRDELSLGWLALHVQRAEREADVALLLEAALFRLPLPPLGKTAGTFKDLPDAHPPGHERSSPGWGTYLCAGLIARSMRHWGLLDLAQDGCEADALQGVSPASGTGAVMSADSVLGSDFAASVPPTAEGRGGSEEVGSGQRQCGGEQWGAGSEPLFFYGRLSDACQAVARTCDAAGRVARVAVCNFILLHAMLQQHAAAAAHHAGTTRRRRKAAESDAEAQAAATSGASGAAMAAASRARMLAGLEEELGEAGAVLLRRLVLHESALMEAVAYKVLLAQAHVGEEALNKLAGRLSCDGVLSEVRRTVGEQVMRALDAAMLDGILRHGLVATFDTALQCKDAVARLERRARELAPAFGFAAPAPEAPAESECTGRAARHELTLPLTRQAADIMMMEKTMLVGPAADEWRAQICPLLSSRRIHRLVTVFKPCASAPDAVTREVREELAREAERQGGALYALPEVLQAVAEMGAPPADVTDLREAAACLAKPAPAALLPAALRANPRFSFLGASQPGCAA